MKAQVNDSGKPEACHHLLQAINEATVGFRKELGCLQWQHSMAQLAVCTQSKGWHPDYTKVGMNVMPVSFNVVQDIISCLTHQIATMSSSTRTIGAPVSHMHSTQ
jgi:predicted DNA-binding ArsR family transcriptional regulator